jgi:hypothetical protein
LKLARCPHSLAATLATLPFMSLVPLAPFFLLTSYFSSGRSHPLLEVHDKIAP